MTVVEFMPVCRFSLRAGDVLITKDLEAGTDIAVPAVVAENVLEVLCGAPISAAVTRKIDARD